MPPVERLRAVAAHTAAAAQTVVTDSSPSRPQDGGGFGAAAQLPDSRPGLYAEPRLLTDDQMAEFLSVGFLVIRKEVMPKQTASLTYHASGIHLLYDTSFVFCPAI